MKTWCDQCRRPADPTVLTGVVVGNHDVAWICPDCVRPAQRRAS